MTDTNFPLSADDDLPRTFRRARREHEAAQLSAATGAPESMTPMAPFSPGMPASASAMGEAPAPAVIRAIDVPFVQLMLFFIKAVFAAIPALIILGILIWFSGEVLTSTFPELLKMKILIQFPN